MNLSVGRFDWGGLGVSCETRIQSFDAGTGYKIKKSESFIPHQFPVLVTVRGQRFPMYSVLYVDDEEALLSLSKLFLESSSNFVVDTLTSAPEAIDQLKTRTYDAILSDYQMPDMDGIQFLKTVRSQFGDIPFILFTGRGREDVIIDAINNGVDFYLQKGGDPRALYAELSHKIRIAIERKIARDASTINEDRLKTLVALHQMSDAPMQELMAFAIKEAVKVTSSTIGYLAFVNEDESEFMMYAWSSAGMEECKIHNKPKRYLVEKTGLWGEAIRQRRPVITNDYSADNPLKKGLPEGHVAIQRCMNIPIFEGNHIVIVAGVGNKATGYLESDVRELSLLMTGLWNVIKRRQAEEALRDSEQRLADIINFLPDATFAIDKRGVVIAWNRAIEEMTGVPSSDMLGKGNHEYALALYPERRPILIDLILEPDPRISELDYSLIKRGNGTLLSETSAPRPRGKPGTFLGKASLLCDKNGEVTGAIESIRDITEARKAHDELQAAYEQIAASEEELRSQYEELKLSRDEIRAANEQITAKDEELRGQLDEIVRAQQALVKNEENFRSLVESAPDPIYISSHERFVYVNPAAVKLLGAVSADELLGMSLYDRIHPSCHAALAERAHLVIDERKSGGLMDMVYLRMDGTPVDVESSVAPFQYQGEPAGLITLRDITVRKQAEDELRAAHERLTITEGALRKQYEKLLASEAEIRAREDQLRGIAATIPGVVFQFYARPGGELGLNYVSEKAREILSLDNDPSDFIHRCIACLPPEDQGVFKESISSAVSRGTEWNYEGKFIKPTGEIIWVHGLSSPSWHGKELVYSGVILEVTDQKQAEEAVKRLTRNDEEALRIARMGHFEFDVATGQFIFNDQFYHAILGITAEEAGGYFMPAAEFANRFAHPEDSHLVQENIEAALTTTDPVYEVQFDSRVLRNNGEIRDITVWFRIEKDQDGRTVRLYGVNQDITERKRVESELVLFKDSVAGASDEVFWLDFNGKILYVNDSACSSTGYSREELIGMEIFRLDPDFNPDKWARSVDDLRKRRNQIFTTRHRRKDGTITEVEIMANYVMRDGKEYSFAFVRDITEKERTARELVESEERYRRLLEQFFDAVIIHQDNVIVYANDAAARLTKTGSPASMIGKNVMDFVDPKCGRLVGDRIRTMNAAPGVAVPLVEERFRCTDGTTVAVEVIATSAIHRGKPAVLVVARDITRRKEIEKERKQSDTRYRLILQSANDAILIHEIVNDHPGRFIEVNDQACHMLGYTREEMLQKSIADIDAPEQTDKVSGIQNELNTQGRVVFQTDHITKDRRRIPVEVSARLIEIDGRPAALSIVRDLSDQKRSEEKVLEANRKLKLLNSITRHDIRNKLTVMDGYLCLAKDKTSDPAVAGFIEKMEIASRDIGEHIEFTKIYQDLGTTEPRWQDLDRALPRSAVPPTVAMYIDLQGVTVHADPLFEKVFANLLDNSLRHGGRVTAIWVSARRSPDGLVIVWEDNGVGIPEKEKEKIFLQGYGKNTGLGLFLSREILAMTGIVIRETGLPGKGARFEITVPEGAFQIRR